MCTINQAAIAALFRFMNRYVGNPRADAGRASGLSTPVIRNTDPDRELTMMRWGIPPRTGGPPVTNIRNVLSELRVQPEPSPKRALEARHRWE